MHNLHVGTNNRPRRSSIQFTAISASGSHSVIVTKKDFQVIKNLPAPLLVSMGTIKRGKYQYGAKENELDVQHPLPDDRIDFSTFSFVALSDEYLAIAADKKIMVFKASGGQAGRWLICDKIQNGSVHGLTFSADGSQFVAVCSVSGSDACEVARIYHTAEFAPTDERSEVKGAQHLLHMNEVPWQASYVYKVRCMAFSFKGDMVAIATSHSKGEAKIKILRLARGRWYYWGERLIKVLDPERPQDMRGAGVTGISLYICRHSEFFLILAFKTMNVWLFHWTPHTPALRIAIRSCMKVRIGSGWSRAHRSQVARKERPMLLSPYLKYTMLWHCSAKRVLIFVLTLSDLVRLASN
jgi:hypothetical protein